MDLDTLLEHDQEAAALFQSLPLQAQQVILRSSGEIDSLTALREHTIDVMQHHGPFYTGRGMDGTRLDAGLKAEWTREHQA